MGQLTPIISCLIHLNPGVLGVQTGVGARKKNTVIPSILMSGVRQRERRDCFLSPGDPVLRSFSSGLRVTGGIVDLTACSKFPILLTRRRGGDAWRASGE